MKKLPVGIPDVAEIIQDNYLYIDKTSHIYPLITEGKYYFLSRPRRFGKSLLLSTLSEIFSGNKGLFKECAIYNMDYSWEKHPILYLDFGGLKTETPQDLEHGLVRRLHKAAQAYDISLEIDSSEEGLEDLIELLAKMNKVVVLIDEYDKPLVDNLTNLEVAKASRTILKTFFSTLKTLNKHLKFVFITGVSRFSQVSLFSGFNNIEDITMRPTSAALLGYTEAEITHYFADRLELLSQHQNKSKSQIIEEMRLWYNGYRFSKEPITVYNPHSTMLFFKTGETACHWFATSTPTFLVEWIKKETFPIQDLSGIEVNESLAVHHDVEKIGFTSLMWQTGYLTIQDYKPSIPSYILDFPNREVKKSFLENLIQEIAPLPGQNLAEYITKMIDALSTQKLENFFQEVEYVFNKIPYDIHIKQEKYYQSLFFLIIQLLGMNPQAEAKTNKGRIDMVIKVCDLIYILEFKIDSTAEEALKQIANKEYFEKYRQEEKQKGKKIILLGINFDSQKRNISEWKTLSLN